MKYSIRLLLVTAAIAGTVSCAPPRGSDTYSRADVGRVATVIKGTIISIRKVKLTGTNSGVGAGAGAIAGGTAGSSVGSGGRANVIGAVGGAVIGGIAGAAAEEAMTHSEAYEFIVQQENDQTVAIVQTNEENLGIGERVLILRSGKARIIRDATVH